MKKYNILDIIKYLTGIVFIDNCNEKLYKFENNILYVKNVIDDFNWEVCKESFNELNIKEYYKWDIWIKIRNLSKDLNIELSKIGQYLLTYNISEFKYYIECCHYKFDFECDLLKTSYKEFESDYPSFKNLYTKLVELTLLLNMDN